MNTFKDWKNKVLKKLDIDTIGDQFDNKKAEGSTVPTPMTTPKNQGKSLTLSFGCNAVSETFFRWLSKYPNLSH
jgi:hypothetical protein